MDKAALRRSMRDKREKRSDTGEEASDLLAVFQDNVTLDPSDVLAFYWPFAAEADPRAIAAESFERGVRCTLPLVCPESSVLSFRDWRPGALLAPGYREIPEPLPGTAEAVPSVLLVPLLACTRTGARLGYGGGHYDRTLEHLRACGKIRAIGVALEMQIVDDLPVEMHDQKLDALLTPRRFLTFGTV